MAVSYKQTETKNAEQAFNLQYSGCGEDESIGPETEFSTSGVVLCGCCWVGEIGPHRRRVVNCRQEVFPMDVSELVTSDPEIMSGTPVFKGTTVYVMFSMTSILPPTDNLPL